jgi:hypothetical protein
MYHDHLRPGAMSSVATPALPDDHMEKPLWINPRTHKASMRGVTLVETRHSCKTGVEFLLT